MGIEKELRELVGKRGLRQTARELGVDSGSLYRSILDGSNVGLDRIEAILNLFGYELKLSKRKEVNSGMKELKIFCPYCEKRVVARWTSNEQIRCPECKKPLARKGRLLSD